MRWGHYQTHTTAGEQRGRRTAQIVEARPRAERETRSSRLAVRLKIDTRTVPRPPQHVDCIHHTVRRLSLFGRRPWT